MFLLFLACTESKPESDQPLPEIEEGAEVLCENPTEMGPARFTESSADRGLTIDRPFFWGERTSFDGNLVVQDMDNDGDYDILMGRTAGAPDAFTNDGTGHFTQVPRLFSDILDRFPAVNTSAAVDLDGDNLPDILMVGLGGVMMARNKGNWEFEEAEVLWLREGSQVPMYLSSALGDYDQDGDLDIVLAGVDWLPKDIYAPTDPSLDQLGTPVQVLLNEGDTFSPLVELTPEGVAGFAMYAVFSDRDLDGDEDLLVSSVQLGFLDRIAPQAFYRNDGGTFVNDAASIGMDLAISGMGGTVVDLNMDGHLDYCMTDTGPVKCMVYQEDGTFYDAGTALGMVPGGFELDWHWSAWSIEVTDLDHDGYPEAAMSAGDELHPRLYWEPWSNNFEPPPEEQTNHVDTLLWGQPDGTFVDQASVIGFDTPDYHYGLVTADMDGDGFQEIINLPGGKGPDYWQNQCGMGSWVEIDPVGDQNNKEAINAIVTVEAGGITHTGQILALRGFGQSPSVAHFGLGEATAVDRVTITWPDGSTSVAENLGINRKITIRK